VENNARGILSMGVKINSIESDSVMERLDCNHGVVEGEDNIPINITSIYLSWRMTFTKAWSRSI